jgi:F-box/TPR repeat protein Pof3
MYVLENLTRSNSSQLLQQLHDKTTRKLSPAKAVDPLLVLPVELAEMVLEHLAFRNMVNCMRVSKGWRDYISKLYRLWMHLDLSDAKRPVSRSFIDKATRRSQYRLNRFTIHRFQHLDVVLNIAKACKGLADVELLSLPIQASASLIELARRAPNLRRYVLHTEISLDAAIQIFRHRPTLEHAEFRSLTGAGNWAIQNMYVDVLLRSWYY